ncbi:recombinase family protein [Aeromonas hydrophila]|uniref:recombinase family protein n=1 Tax=Aeromonas hydrophila TaxID=644 RepID=UPI00236156AB|nr:recombinase family protein [Aeromonas hydrophila]
MKSYLYSRISTLQQVQGFGIERQIQTVTDFLENAVLDSRLGYQLDPNDYEILESDIGKSAFRGNNWKPNSNLGRFYDDVINKRITRGALIVENIDRLTRLSNYQASHKLSTLITHGIDIIEVESGTCFSDRIPESNSILNMSISRAHNESKRKSNMGQKTWTNRISKLRDEGKASVKICPRWLTVQDGKYILDPEQAAILLSIHQQYVEGHGSSAIVRRLNDEGKLNSGKPWNTLTLHKVLRDERLTGKMVIGKQRVVDTSKSQEEQKKQREEIKNNLITVDDAFPVVVNQELFNRVQAKINSSKHGTQKPKTTKLMRNLFNGISTCGVCRNPFIVCSNGRGNLFYTCLGRRSEKTCTNVGVRYTQFEMSILRHIKELNWNSIYNSENEKTDSLNECRQKILDVERRIGDFNRELADLDDDDLELHIIRKIKKNKEILNELVIELNTLMANSDTYTDFNPDLNLVHDQSNTYLRQDTNVALRKVIRQLSIAREGSLVQCWIKYYTDSISHLFIYDVKKENVVSKTYITDDGVFHFDAGSINILTGTINITSTELKEEDKIAFELWVAMIEESTRQA